MYEIIYYESFKENYPVFEFISSQHPKEQAKILREIDLLQRFGLSLGMPHLRKIKNINLWELRIMHGSNIFRILFKDLDKKNILTTSRLSKKTRENSQEGNRYRFEKVDKIFRKRGSIMKHEEVKKNYWETLM